MADAANADTQVHVQVETSEIQYLGDVQRLELRPDDIIVLFVADNLNPQNVLRIEKQVEENIPGHKVLVLVGEMKIGVMSPTEAQKP